MGELLTGTTKIEISHNTALGKSRTEERLRLWRKTLEQDPPCHGRESLHLSHHHQPIMQCGANRNAQIAPQHGWAR